MAKQINTVFWFPLAVGCLNYSEIYLKSLMIQIKHFYLMPSKEGEIKCSVTCSLREKIVGYPFAFL